MGVWWLAVFERLLHLDVAQGDGSMVRQAVPQKWSLNGTAEFPPGTPAGDAAAEVERLCRASSDIPEDAMLVNLNLIPDRLFGNVE